MLLSELAVCEPSHYRSEFPTFAQPREVACFSRDADRGVHLDRRALRPYAPPSLPAPLDVGFDSFQPKDSADDPAPLKDIVTALSSRKITPQKGQFITFRNNLNKLMGTPYSLNDDWEMGVCVQPGGAVELHVRETERKRLEEANRDDRSRRMCYWGYRFEQLCTSHASGSGTSASSGKSASASSGSASGGFRVPSPSDPSSYADLYPPAKRAELERRYAHLHEGSQVNANEEFCGVMKLELAGIKIFMGAEIDCSGENGYIELKTSKQISNPSDSFKFEKYKLLKFWLQSFLAGVPRIIVGFRDDAGMVHKLQTIKTLEIPRMVRGKSGMWDPAVCFSFGKLVLQWLLAEVEKAPINALLVLRYEPSRRVLLLTQDAGKLSERNMHPPPFDGPSHLPPEKYQRVDRHY